MFRWLIAPTTTGLYFSIDEATGRAAFRVPFEPRAPGAGVDARYNSKPYTGTVSEISTNIGSMHPQIKKAFIKWTKTVDPDLLNKLVNAPIAEGDQ